uniref:Uncharacterized protein n=1 Tax=Mesocestoides corti TaxID=53468 RepID=A0A5K3EXP8_MESCO
MEGTGTTEQALLTDHKHESHVRRCPSESTTLVAPLVMYRFSKLFVSDWLSTFLAYHWNAE